MCKRREYAYKVLATVSVLFEIVSFALFITQYYKLPFTKFNLVALTERRRQNCTFRNLSLSFCVSSSELGTIPLAENMVDVIWCHIMVWCYNMVSWCDVRIWCDVIIWCHLWCDVIIWCHFMVWCYGVMVWCYDMVSYYGAVIMWCLIMVRCYNMVPYYGMML